ncbi:hypothetical protein D6C99_09963 [Aureobasidium pullulans]|nr:hypothetical protein D6C99_09963 [Aureobasidium pullulans]
MSVTLGLTTWECQICGEESAQLFLLPCGHQVQCTQCINRNFTGLNEVNPRPACLVCSATIPLASVRHVLPANVFSHLEQEFETWTIPAPERRYCFFAPCSRFLGSSRTGPRLHCPSCNNSTCSECKKAAHAGFCTPNTEFAETLNSIDTNFSQCPHCNYLLERTEGCPHMTCICSYQFCLFCKFDWAVCQGNCEAARHDIHQLHEAFVLEEDPLVHQTEARQLRRAFRELVARLNERAQELERLQIAYARAEMTGKIAILFVILRFHLRGRLEYLSTLTFEDVLQVVELRRELTRMTIDLFTSPGEIQELADRIADFGRMVEVVESTGEQRAENLRYLIRELYEPLDLES